MEKLDCNKTNVQYMHYSFGPANYDRFETIVLMDVNVSATEIKTLIKLALMHNHTGNDIELIFQFMVVNFPLG